VNPLLHLAGLNVYLGRGRREVRIISDLSLAMAPGETIGIVGESGCGKTVTGLAILGLLPEGESRMEGSILFEGRDLVQATAAEMDAVRGRRIAMIFQDPGAALDPVFTVGAQIAETIRTHFPVTAKEARERAIHALARVGIPAPAKRYNDYPHQFSGGMRQRAMIAIALACEPALLIADEPTTALDVTVQAQIIDLLLERVAASGAGLLFITHDLGVVAEACTRIVTMYAGELVEDGPTDEVLARPLHPYTSGLLTSLPRLSPPKSMLPSIPGRVLAPSERGDGCRFASRCAFAGDACGAVQSLCGLASHQARCWRQSEIMLPGIAP
jgi:peptide/nickel transport system ATP-binding protein